MTSKGTSVFTIYLFINYLFIFTIYYVSNLQIYRVGIYNDRGSTQIMSNEESEWLQNDQVYLLFIYLFINYLFIFTIYYVLNFANLASINLQRKQPLTLMFMKFTHDND